MHLILLDIDLTDMNEHTKLKALKQSFSKKFVRVIVDTKDKARLRLQTS